MLRSSKMEHVYLELILGASHYDAVLPIQLQVSTQNLQL